MATTRQDMNRADSRSTLWTAVLIIAAAALAYAAYASYRNNTLYSDNMTAPLTSMNDNNNAVRAGETQPATATQQ